MARDATAFFGRKAELDQFTAELRNPRGAAILVVGQQGMGKSALLKEMVVERAAHDPTVKCRSAWFHVTDGDSPELTMSLIMSDAAAAAEAHAGLLSITDQGRRQLRAIFELLPKGEAITKLCDSLKQNSKLHIREQLRSMLCLLSDRLPDDSRAIFVIEPRKYLGKGSGDEWAIVLEDLPDRIKFVIEQRPEDAIATNDSFGAIPNLVRIPQQHLAVWPPKDVEECLASFTPPSGIRMSDVRTAMNHYDRHPFAIMKALDLIQDGEPLGRLPRHPEPQKFAEHQWDRISEQHGQDAVRLMQAYAVLEVPVPDDLAIESAGIDVASFETLIRRPFISSLMPVQPQSTDRSLYHTVFARLVRDRADATGATDAIQQRVIKAYRSRLSATPPDGLAARRLAVHVLAVEGKDAFVRCFVNECAPKLRQLGLLDEIIALTDQALQLVPAGGEEQACLYGNLGIVMRTRGDLDGAEAMYRKALEINEKLGLLEGMAIQYGNLGIVMGIRGDLEGAEAMYRKSLVIDEKLGRLEGMANNYGNLGVVMDTRGDLDGAEAMYRKALAINEKLGRLEGMADQYCNLGNVMGIRGDLEGAEVMYRKALEIDEKLGRLEGMANQYGNLGIVMRKRGDLDGAEAMYRKSLEIDEKLGRLEGMASQYGNLGALMKARGNIDDTLAMWTKSRAFYAKLGAQHMVERVQGLIDALPK